MLTTIDSMQGEDEEDTRLLNEMSIRARDYITSFHWCPAITSMFRWRYRLHRGHFPF